MRIVPLRNRIEGCTVDAGWFVLIFLYVVANVFISLGIGSAAEKKDRSFSGFFWLSFLFSPFLPALVVAALPFRDSDERHPKNKRATAAALLAGSDVLETVRADRVTAPKRSQISD